MAVDIRDKHAVVVAVRDHETASSIVPGDFAGERERALAAGLTDQTKASASQQRFLVVLLEPAVDQRRDHVFGQFALVQADHVAARVDEVERGPGARAECLPVGEVGIVEHRVLDPQPQDGLAQILSLPFGRELGRMHGDDLDGVGVAALDLPQLRKHM